MGMIQERGKAMMQEGLAAYLRRRESGVWDEGKWPGRSTGRAQCWRAGEQAQGPQLEAVGTGVGRACF